MSGQLASQVRVSTAQEAESLISDLRQIMSGLEDVLKRETGFVRDGHLREGLAEEAAKSELSSAYILMLESLKSNALALARFAPSALEALKAAHHDFTHIIQVNQTVLATARAVSEGIVKGIADEMRKTSSPQGYAPAYGQQQKRESVEPLLVSRQL